MGQTLVKPFRNNAVAVNMSHVLVSVVLDGVEEIKIVNIPQVS